MCLITSLWLIVEFISFVDLQYEYDSLVCIALSLILLAFSLTPLDFECFCMINNDFCCFLLEEPVQEQKQEQVQDYEREQEQEQEHKQEPEQEQVCLHKLQHNEKALRA